MAFHHERGGVIGSSEKPALFVIQTISEGNLDIATYFVVVCCTLVSQLLKVRNFLAKPPPIATRRVSAAYLALFVVHRKTKYITWRERNYFKYVRPIAAQINELCSKETVNT